MGFIFAPPPQAVLPIVGEPEALFPLRRVFHIGHNYAAHNKDLGAPDEPVIFLKPVDAVVPVPEGQLAAVPYPPMSSNFQHEIELVVALKSGGRNLTEEQAAACVYGYAVGIDFTRRDWHFAMRDKGQPWEKGKTCDAALPVTAIRKAADVGDIGNLQIWLDVNGERRQEGATSQMMHSAASLIAHLSTFWELKPGDIVFTGTPKGVGPVKKGDRLTGGISNVGELNVLIV
ncbi:MAG: fumarylacetoacetate hydrolase family protein [Duodenibacillus sp.]|nr:fumarylacetoacetate hydrolase family protein [Duodenibacillus sp.]